MSIIAARTPTPAGQRAQTRIILLALVFFLAGAAFGAFWFYHAGKREAGANPSGTEAGLGGGTQSVLKQLDSPIEIHFYSLLDPASVSDSTREFSARVNQLLAQYEREAGGKIKVTRFSSPSNFASDAAAAAADGLRPFNLDKGEACYLGIAVIRNGRKESLAQLSPEWESALESDLTHAIARTAGPGAAAAPLSTDPAVAAAVRKAVPNLESLSLEQGTQVLRDAALNEFKSAVAEMDAQVKTAEQAVTQAQNGGTPAQQQAAFSHLQEVQTQAAQKIQQIAARSQAQVDALKQLKSGR